MSRKNVFKKMSEAAVDTVKVVNEKLQFAVESSRQTLDATKEEAKKMGKSAMDNVKDKVEDKNEKLGDALESSKQALEDKKYEAMEKGESALNKVKDKIDDGNEKLGVSLDSLKQAIEDTKDEAKKMGWLETTKVKIEDGKDIAHNVFETAKKVGGDFLETAKEFTASKTLVDDKKEKAKKVDNATKDNIEDGK